MYSRRHCNMVNIRSLKMEQGHTICTGHLWKLKVLRPIYSRPAYRLLQFAECLLPQRVSTSPFHPIRKTWPASEERNASIVPTCIRPQLVFSLLLFAAGVPRSKQTLQALKVWSSSSALLLNLISTSFICYPGYGQEAT